MTAMLDPVAIFDLRLVLQEAGFEPIPLAGKRPLLAGWNAKHGVNREEMASWGLDHPDWSNTGTLPECIPCSLKIRACSQW
jgi:hypothetical protein